MADQIVAPVRNIIKAFETGIKLANKVSRSASDVSAAQALQISESARSLQRSLEKSSQIISDSYKQHVGSCGEPFGKALEDDGESSAIRMIAYADSLQMNSNNDSRTCGRM